MNTVNVIYKVITIFLLICAGYAARKLKWIDDRMSRGLSQLVICGAQPFMIVGKVIAIPSSRENIITGGIILLISFAVHLILGVLGFVFARPIKDIGERKISEFSLLFVNCGFAGIPLLEAAFGSRGAFWCAVYVIAYNLIQWSYGMVLLGRADPSIRMNFKKAILNFGTIPCIIGMVLFATGLGEKIPAPVTDAMNILGSLCTPLTMIIIGGIVATIPIKKLFTDAKVYYICAVKLLVLPLIVTFLGKALGLADVYVIFAAMMAALPTAANSGVFAEKYDICPQYASHLVGMSTVLSAITIPAIVYLAQRILTLW